MPRPRNFLERMLGKHPQPEAPQNTQSVVKCYVEGPQDVYAQLTQSGRVDTTFIFELSVDSRDAQAYSKVLRQISEMSRDEILLQHVSQAAQTGEIMIGNLPAHPSEAKMTVDWNQFTVGVLKVTLKYQSLNPHPHLQR